MPGARAATPSLGLPHSSPDLLGAGSRGALLEVHDVRRQTDGREPQDSRDTPGRQAEGRELRRPASWPAGGTDPTRTRPALGALCRIRRRANLRHVASRHHMMVKRVHSLTSCTLNSSISKFPTSGGVLEVTRAYPTNGALGPSRRSSAVNSE